MLIEKEGYKGAVMGDLLDSKLTDEMSQTAEIIGSAMARQGYQGRLSIDYVVSRNNKLYAIEVNAGRRSGSVHVHDVLKVLQAQNPALMNVLVYDHFTLPVQGPLSYSDVRPVFQNFHENSPVSNCLYMPLMISTLQNNHPYLGYMIIGTSHAAISESKAILEQALIDQVSS